MTDDGAIGLFSSSFGESYLVRFPHREPGDTPRQKLESTPNGFAVAGSQALLWTFADDSRGRLSLVDLGDGAEKPIYSGPVLENASPAFVGGRIWWVTERDGAPVVAYFDEGGSAAAEIRHSAPPPDGKEPRFAFTRQAAVLVSESAGLFAWSPSGAGFPGGGPPEEWTGWQRLPSPPSSQVAGAFDSTLLAVDAESKALLALRPWQAERTWDTFYHTAPNHRIDPLSLRGSATHVVFVEKSSEEDAWMVRVSLADGSVFRQPAPVDLTSPGPTSFWCWDGSWLAAVGQRESRLWLLSERTGHPGSTNLHSPNLHSPAVGGPDPPAAVPKVTPPGPPRETFQVAPDDAAARALRWLKSQLTTPSDGTGTTVTLIDSYEDDVDAGWIYDAALATIAFTAVGEREVARRLLHGLEGLQVEDGSWTFSYEPSRARPLGNQRYVGSMAWVVMAVNFYEWESGDDRFADMARRALAYFERFRQEDRTEPSYGAISMGPANPQAYSTEHNLDCYSAFLWRGKLDHEPRYLRIAADIRRFVLEVQWAETTMGPGQRFFKVGYRDNEIYLDAQSWSVLAFWDGEGPARVREALRTAERRLLLHDGRLGQVTDVLGFKEAEGVAIGDKVWAEGTEGVVAALYAVGENQKAAAYHAQTARYQTASGGIPYATENADGWSTAPSVASTAWFVFNALSPPRNPFHPGPVNSRR